MPPPVYELTITDRATGVELADISTIASEKAGAHRTSRPSVWKFRVPPWHELIAGNAGDGFPILCEGRRRLKVRRTPSTGGAAELVYHGRLWKIDTVGDHDTVSAEVTCVDAMHWWKSRPVRDSTGNFSNPTFESPISGAQLLVQALDNSVVNGGGAGDMEGPHEINTSDGLLDLASPPAPDLSVSLLNWPIMIADLATLLTNTGAVDVWLRYVDELDGFGPDISAVLNAQTIAGIDRPGVHFDYATGDHSVQRIRYSRDMDTVANKLYMYLGPKQLKPDGTPDPEHWKGLITGDDPGLPNPPGGDVDYPNPLGDLINASRAAHGVLMHIDIYDDNGNENDARPLFWRLWQTEALLRVKPRELLHITPIAGAPFLPWEHYRYGDVIRVNAGAQLGFPFADAEQRVYGWDVTVDDDGVERPGELIVSADGG